MMHEILRQNIGRIDHVWDWIEASDVVSSFSLEMDFTHDLFEKYPDKNYFSFMFLWFSRFTLKVFIISCY